VTALARTSVRLAALAAALSLAPLARAGNLPRREAGAPLRPAAEKSSVSLEDFVEALEPWGTWKVHPRWGKVWRPGVDAEWQPYVRGRWARTAEGWYWVSDEPWAWATYHFGRWFLDPFSGWTWVPGKRWAPSWVQWREGKTLLGWAPLPPEGAVFGASYTFVPRDRVEGPAEQAAIPPTRLALALKLTRPSGAPPPPQRALAVARGR
jgi:hypothetical protein